jgi:hypothetical protein
VLSLFKELSLKIGFLKNFKDFFKELFSVFSTLRNKVEKLKNSKKGEQKHF